KHWILADGQPVPANETGAAEYVIVETEITQLKEQEAAIQASEKQMNAFFTGTASLHILFDTHLRIVTFNKVAEQAIEKYMKKKLLVGESMLAVVSDSTRERFLHFALEAINGRPTINREAEIPLGSGEEPLWWVISDIPAYDSFGKIMGVAFTAFDITERKRAEEKIKRQNRLIRELAWRQSHLVRVPLANILSLAELLQTERNDRELLYALDEEAKRLDKVICDVVRKTVAS
ncbi:MAG TPA: PAS domain-containing protein, partial [Chitinophagaceae bacterium]|nr:PAS domain-containing protein [Chitinophagaceae bacterium]